MRTPGIKFDLVTYAKKHGYGIASFDLNDGTRMTIIHNPNTRTDHFCREKDGVLYGGFSIGNTISDNKTFEYIKSIREFAQDRGKMIRAWVASHTKL